MAISTNAETAAIKSRPTRLTGILMMATVGSAYTDQSRTEWSVYSILATADSFSKINLIKSPVVVAQFDWRSSACVESFSSFSWFQLKLMVETIITYVCVCVCCPSLSALSSVNKADLLCLNLKQTRNTADLYELHMLTTVHLVDLIRSSQCTITLTPLYIISIM